MKYINRSLFLIVVGLAFGVWNGCKKEGLCRDLMACSMQGRCTNEGDLCVAKSDAECKQSSSCKEYGFCRAVKGKCEY